MDQNILEELFESPAKVKALKLFLRNPSEAFSLKDGAKRIKVLGRDLTRQVKKFLAIDLVRARTVRSEKKVGKRIRRKKETVYFANPHFAFYTELRNLVLKSSPTVWDKKLKALMKLGRVKLAVISGWLLNDEKARVDVLVVGDKLNMRSAAAFMRNLEADVGKELRYVLLTPQEFIYRFGMYDNFLRDVFDRPHKKLVNKMKTIVGD
ncbi:MAG: hypothetical protein Q8Q39_04610 [bacterium]|nr:hypothetical protein [bacterium]